MDLKRLGNTQKNITEHNQSDEIKDDIQKAYDSVKQVKSKLKKFGKTNKEMSTLKKALRNMVDELEDLEDLDFENSQSEEEGEVTNKNEQSEGYGTWKGLGMDESVVKLSNRDLNSIFENISNEKNLLSEDKYLTYRQVNRCRNGNSPACVWLDCKYDKCGCTYCCEDNNTPCSKVAPGGGVDLEMDSREKISESRLLLERPTAEEAREGCFAEPHGSCCRCYFHGSNNSCKTCEKDLNPDNEKVKPTSNDVSTIVSDVEDAVLESYKLIRQTIIREQNTKLRLYDYGLINEQGQYNRNPGVAAAEGIENIIDNLKKAWSMLKDSTTRKQIQNTLVKLNNFMMYSAELVNSGQRQSSPRSYDQLANPLPFPELDEPEELEDIDDEYSGGESKR